MGSGEMRWIIVGVVRQIFMGCREVMEGGEASVEVGG